MLPTESSIARGLAISVCAILTFTASVAGAQLREAPLTTADRFDRAWSSWQAGRYDGSLEDLKLVLASPDAASFHDRVAELTGEVWRTVEVARDARAPRWSPDGRYLAFETGVAAERRVRVVRADALSDPIVDASGSALTFSPDGRTVAWMANGVNGRPLVRWRSLAGGPIEDIGVDAGGAVALTLIGGSPLRVALITGSQGDTTASLYLRDLTGRDLTWQKVDVADGQPVDIVRSANGSRILVTLGRRGAFARAMPGFGGTARADAFAELSEGRSGVRIPGTAPVVSNDGSTVAWMTRDSTHWRIHTLRSAASQVTVTASVTPVQGLAIAPDGSRVAWQTVLREDWELFTASAEGGEEPSRLTREIQHDLMPQFLSPTSVLGVIGEARHRRSHLYDLTTGTRTRLFHNNSVRTVAPEYEWVPSPDGTRVAIVSERDGDTVTPHRHLYLMDLTERVSHGSLVARVDSNLVAERALRANGTRMFAPIALAVRDATSAVDVARIYSYEKDLFDFDSKHITQKGNWQATEYLLAKYRSFGLKAHLQRFTTVVGREIEVANVVAVIPGTTNPELVYVVGAHFDSRDVGPGADDNTSGTAMILEAARVLSTRPLPATVMFVSFTGEESGLRGAREFGRRMKDSLNVVGALNNDMMGWSNDFRMDNTIRYSNPGIRDVQHAAAIGFSRLITYDAFYYKSTDAHALFDAWGDVIGGIGSYPILGNPHYHQTHDVLETINHEQLAETSRTTVATIMLLASSPSRLTGLAATATQATWNASPEKGIVRYLVQWGPQSDPTRFSATVTSPRATLSGAQVGWKVAVKAVNGRGLEGWDWARADVR